MATILFTRTWHSVISLLCLLVVVFVLARMTGNPADLFVPIDAPPEFREQFAQQHGLNDPILEQFWRFLVGAATLNFGGSLKYSRPALDLVLEAFPTTLLLALYSMSLALGIAIVTGALAAWRPNGPFDRIAGLIALAGASIPPFWIAIVMVIVFAVQLRLLPTSGTGSVLHWIMPILVLMIRPCGVIVKVVRNSMLTALSSAYVKTARAKGVRGRTIIFVHALRNATLPIITVTGDQTAHIVNGAVIVETIYGFPGIGKLMIDSIYLRDFAVIQASVLVTAVAVFIMNVLVDVAYALLDPRVRHA